MSEDLKAGRKLDALVAEKVFGCKTFMSEPFTFLHGVVSEPGPCCGCKWKEHDSNIYSIDSLKPYSTDIAAAWEVVEKLKATISELEIEISSSSEYPDEWETSVKWLDDKEGHGPFYLTAKTAPLSICLAALKAVK